MIGDKFFIKTALLLAEESQYVSLKVGAVIVKDKRIISMGYNGTVQNTINCADALKEELYELDKHSEWSDSHEIHAEMNALMFAAKHGLSVDGCTLYCTHEPCDHCLKNIIQSGIKKVVYITPYKRERCKSTYRFDKNIITMVKYDI